MTTPNLDERRNQAFSGLLRCPFCGSKEITLFLGGLRTDKFHDPRMKYMGCTYMPGGRLQHGSCASCGATDGVDYALGIAHRLFGLEQWLSDAEINAIMKVMAEQMLAAEERRSIEGYSLQGE